MENIRSLRTGGNLENPSSLQVHQARSLRHRDRARDRIVGHNYEHRNRRHNQLLGTRSAKPMSVRLRTRAGRARINNPTWTKTQRRNGVKSKQNLTHCWSENETSVKMRHASSSLGGHEVILLVYHHSIRVYYYTCAFNKQKAYPNPLSQHPL